jgi:SOS-response transcriptional repressor LexA
MFGYRSGKYPVTAKALRKLEEAERLAGITPSPFPQPAAISDFAGYDTKVNEDSPIYGNKGMDCRPWLRGVPAVGWAHAGEAESYEEMPFSWRNQIPTDCPDAKAFAVYLEGDSMEPKFSDGDILIVQPTAEPHSGCFVVARFADDGVIFRRFEMIGKTIRLVPLNSRYPATDHQPRDFSWIYPVWGRVTQIWRR